MAIVSESRKACSVNPLKMSQPLGAAYAFMGLDACMPVMHGSQGCTSFGIVLLVRHFKEAIPLQTTAMNEVTTILGGYENLETALMNIRNRAKPNVIAVCSTGLTETKGDDVDGYLQTVRRRKPELDDTALLYVSTPDYVGAFEDGYAKAVTQMVQQFCTPFGARIERQINLLPGAHVTPGDIEEISEILEAFGLKVIALPNVARSLDGHIPEDWRGTTIGGTTLDEMATMGGSIATIAVGEHMRSAAIELEMRAGVPYYVFDRLTGLEPCDNFLQTIAQISGQPVPQKYRRERGQLLDAMLDGHFHFGGKKVAIGAEPDLLFAAGSLLHEMGAILHTCITTTHSPVLERMPTEKVIIGDIEDLENGAKDCDLMITHSHGRQTAARLNIPFYRMGIPMFDRIGNSHRVSVGYRGTMNLIFDIGNLLMEHIWHGEPDSWPLPEESIAAAQRPAPIVVNDSEGGGCGTGCGCATAVSDDVAGQSETLTTTGAAS